MSYRLKDFLTAEIEEIARSMDEDSRKDREAFTRKAIEWIERNGKRFREEWCRTRGKQGPS